MLGFEGLHDVWVSGASSRVLGGSLPPWCACNFQDRPTFVGNTTVTTG